MNRPRLATDVASLDLSRDQPIVLVPTMGGLHAGHLALVQQARTHADRVGAQVCVSIFVNPLQFGPQEDFDTYPRQLDTDLDLLAGRADICFAPTSAQMYPQRQKIFVQAPDLGAQLCGRHRPNFFTGVLTVVHKLFSLTRANVAVFGAKDYQQLVLIRQMITQLHLNINLICVPTIRAADGLALSSRNTNLSKTARALAPLLHTQLLAARQAIIATGNAADACATAHTQLNAAGFTIDYIECRAAADLAAWTGAGAFVVLGAAYLDGVRLIDNTADTA